MAPGRKAIPARQIAAHAPAPPQFPLPPTVQSTLCWCWPQQPPQLFVFDPQQCAAFPTHRYFVMFRTTIKRKLACITLLQGCILYRCSVSVKRVTQSRLKKCGEMVAWWHGLHSCACLLFSPLACRPVPSSSVAVGKGIVPCPGVLSFSDSPMC